MFEAAPAQSLSLHLIDHGAQLFAQVLDERLCSSMEAALESLPANRPGVRIDKGAKLLPFLAATGPIGSIAAEVLGPQARPVRAILFDKSTERNWALGWHQDRTIVVRERRESKGFGHWSVKAGLIQVEPPFEILERMLTFRVHLDDVDESNAPLRIVPGSHKSGRLTEEEIGAVVDRLGQQTCLAKRGDIWIYSTPIVHSSQAANPPRRRRVLQIDYSGDCKPGLLEWRGL
jgi:hypothetical protein